MKMALDKIAFLPFGLMVDRWRWEVFSGKITPEHYNESLVGTARQYQGLTPPGPARPTPSIPGPSTMCQATPVHALLPGASTVPVPPRGLQTGGWKGRCTAARSTAARTWAKSSTQMLEMGQSQPWPVALERFTGERDMDATAVTAYFAPLNTWLIAQNKGKKCGW
jgi:peptidyl-dipeptidase A